MGRPRKPYPSSLAQPVLGGKNKPMLAGSATVLEEAGITDRSVIIANGKMRISAYLIIDENGGLSVRKGKPALTGGQVSVRLEVELPDDYFYKAVPTAKLTLSDEHIMQPDIAIVAKHAFDKL